MLHFALESTLHKFGKGLEKEFMGDACAAAIVKFKAERFEDSVVAARVTVERWRDAAPAASRSSSASPAAAPWRMRRW